MSLFNKIREWRNYRLAVEELNRLTDRDLADIGVARSQIETAARKGR